MKSRKVAIVGARLVGKLLMLVKYVEDQFVEDYYPTISAHYTKTLTFRGAPFELEIVDTAGQDEFSMVEESQLIGIHGYMLVYLVTLRQLFELIELIRDKILNAVGTEDPLGVPMVVVGNKCDLSMQRVVLTLEGAALARGLHCPFVETLVKDNLRIAEAFEAVLAGIEGAADAPSKCVIV
ncbi:GTP-binding protein [Kocuria palustris]|nr:GTP-binding protein [Kocuria palustris]